MGYWFKGYGRSYYGFTHSDLADMRSRNYIKPRKRIIKNINITIDVINSVCNTNIDNYIIPYEDLAYINVKTSVGQTSFYKNHYTNAINYFEGVKQTILNEAKKNQDNNEAIKKLEALFSVVYKPVNIKLTKQYSAIVRNYNTFMGRDLRKLVSSKGWIIFSVVITLIGVILLNPIIIGIGALEVFGSLKTRKKLKNS